MGLVNTVVPLEQVEDETVKWCKDIMQHFHQLYVS